MSVMPGRCLSTARFSIQSGRYECKSRKEIVVVQERRRSVW